MTGGHFNVKTKKMMDIINGTHTMNKMKEFVFMKRSGKGIIATIVLTLSMSIGMGATVLAGDIDIATAQRQSIIPSSGDVMYRLGGYTEQDLITGFTYEGTPLEYNTDYALLMQWNTYRLEKAEEVNSGIYYITIFGKGRFTGSYQIDFNIIQRKVDKPVKATTPVYDGTQKCGVEMLDGTEDYIEVTGGTATAVGSYTATVKLKDKERCTWPDGTTDDFTIDWEIKGGSDGPKPKPDPNPKEQLDYELLSLLFGNEKASNTKNVEKKAEIVDRDTYKSEEPSKTVMSTDTLGSEKFLDLKVHSVDNRTAVNQKFLAQTLVGPNVQILLTEGIYARRDLSVKENGSLETLTRNNLPKNQAGPVYAVVYNQIDGAYEINGVLDTNGTATFSGFKLRPASTITICK